MSLLYTFDMKSNMSVFSYEEHQTWRNEVTGTTISKVEQGIESGSPEC